MYVVEGMRHVQMAVGGMRCVLQVADGMLFMLESMRCIPEVLEVVINVLEVWRLCGLYCGSYSMCWSY